MRNQTIIIAPEVELDFHRGAHQSFGILKIKGVHVQIKVEDAEEIAVNVLPQSELTWSLNLMKGDMCFNDRYPNGR